MHRERERERVSIQKCDQGCSQLYSFFKIGILRKIMEARTVIAVLNYVLLDKTNTPVSFKLKAKESSSR